VPTSPGLTARGGASDCGIFLYMAYRPGRTRLLTSLIVLGCATVCADDTAKQVRRLNEEGRLLLSEHKFEQAISLEEKALQLASTAPNFDQSLLATLTRNLANAYDTKGDFSNGRVYAERALRLCDANAKCRDSRDLVETLMQLGRAEKGLQHYDPALSTYERAFPMAEARCGKASLNVAYIAIELAQIYHEKLRLTDSERYFQRGLAIYSEKRPGTEDNIVALTKFAHYLHVSGDFTRAEQIYRKEIDLIEALRGTDSPELTQPLYDLVALHRFRNEYWLADPFQERLDRICQKFPDSAVCKNGTRTPGGEAVQLMQRGDSAHAIALLRQFIDEHDKAHRDAPDSQIEKAHLESAVSELAVIYEGLGEYASAARIRERIVTFTTPPNPLARYDVARDLDRAGERNKADQLYRELMPGIEAQFERYIATPPTPFGYNFAESMAAPLAEYYASHGNVDRAETVLSRSLAYYTAFRSEDPIYLRFLLYRAGFFSRFGRHERAVQFYQQVLAAREKSLGPDHPEVAAILVSLATEAMRQQDVTKAQALLTRASTIENQSIAMLLGYGSVNDNQLLLRRYMASLYLTSSLYYDFARDNTDLMEAAFTEVLRRKGRALESVERALRAIRAEATESDRAVIDEWSQVRALRASLVLRGPAPSESDNYQTKLRELSARNDELEKTISSRFKSLQQQTQPVTIAQVRARLPANGALVEIVYSRPFDVAKNGWGPPRFLVFVLRREGPLECLSLGSVAAIDELALRFRRALGSPSTDPREIAREFDERVVKPIRDRLGSSTRVYLSPDGSLNLVPFSAAIDESGHFILSRYSFSYLTAGRDLIRQYSETSNPPAIFADPDFGAAGDGGETSSRGPRSADLRLIFDQLPGTAAEARKIEAILPGAKLFSGREASETALKQIHSPSILHIATHGFFLSDQEASLGARGATVAYEPAPDPSTSDAALPMNGEDPLLRSGLALACANAPCGGPDDGILTALEAATLDLRGTRLVVLSACETGLGDVQNGDGVYGLRRAFVMAGARNQVMSLWKVDDEGTSEFMPRFYQELTADVGTETALRRVQERTIETSQRAHPFYWAAFIASGPQTDW
jgi:CHAT domain-containing protein